MKKDLRQNNFLSTVLRIPQYALLCMRSLVLQILAFQFFLVKLIGLIVYRKNFTNHKIEDMLYMLNHTLRHFHE